MRCRPQAHRTRGFSIIEIMVALTISSLMFVVIIQLFASNKQAYRLQEGSSQLNESARFAINNLQYFMRLADHWGGVEQDNVALDGGLPALAICTTSADDNVINNIGFRGYNGAAVAPINCMTDYEPQTDAFFIRYGIVHADGCDVDDTAAPYPLNGVPPLPGVRPDASCTDPYEPVQATYFGDADSAGIWVASAIGRRAVIFQNTDYGSIAGDVQFDANTVTRGAGNFLRMQSMLYYIRSCSTAACTDSIPTLVRRVLTPGLGFVTEEIVVGVENMQLLYGVDSDPEPDFVADRYIDAAEVGANDWWDRVVTVRIRLIVANTERDTTFEDGRTYYSLDPDDPTWTPAADEANGLDQHNRRSQFDFTVQIRNMTRA